MKRFFTFFAIFIVCNGWFNAFIAQAQGAQDETLAAAVRRHLELEPTDPIDWEELEEFFDTSGSIKSFKGLELATNLVRLEIFDSPIRDLTPLTNLKKLRELTLLGCEISDITPLAGLIHLESLILSTRLGSSNRISDITPIAGLIQLEYLDLAYHEIRDIRPVAGLTQLNTLTLAVNQISDITPIAGLTQLESLGLEINQISDITPLARLTQLVSLSLRHNQVSDITPLTRLTALEKLILGDNEFRDITSLAGMTRLEALDLHGNQINDLTPLIGMTRLEALDLGGNQINNITPLAGLTWLRGLGLSANQINDLTPLAGLRKLQALFLACNQISNITPLIGLTKLERLDLEEHWSVDVDRLKTLPKLTKLRFRGDSFDLYSLEIVSPNVHTLNFPITPLRNFQPVCAAGESKRETSPQETPPQETSSQETFPQISVSTSTNEVELPPMYWVDSESKTLSRLTDGEVEALLPSIQNATSLAVDVGDEKLYWTEKTSNTIGKIRRANLDGTNVRLVKNLTSVPHGIALDTVNRKIYLTNAWGQVQRMNLDGSNFEPNLITGLDMPKSLALDISRDKVYWTEMSGRIRCANLDGTNVQDVAIGLGTPMDLVVFDGTVYWTEMTGENQGKIQRVGLNGTNTEMLLTLTSIPRGIALDPLENKLYWTNSRGKIQRANLDGSDFQPNVVTGLAAPGTIVVVVKPKEILPTDTLLSISPSPVESPAVGERLTLNLNITGGEAVAGYQATLQFDATALRYVESSTGDYLPTGASFVPPVVKGNRVAFAVTARAGVGNSDGTLATVIFEVLAAKTSTLTLSETLLSDSQGNTFRPRVEGGEITGPLKPKEDVNADGIVNIQDLVLVASGFGQTGENTADVNADGIVNIQDLVLVANAFGSGAAAAPILHLQAIEGFTASDVARLLTQAREMSHTDPAYLRGITVLEQLLASLLPRETVLLPNYPNPFNPETWIPYQLAKPADVALRIYDVNGGLVRTLTFGHQPAGVYQNRSRAAYWNGRNALGEKVASGIYFYTLSAGDFTATRKMLIMK